MTSTELAEKLGITYRQLDYWARSGLVDGQHHPTGSGSRRRWNADHVERVALLARAARIKRLTIGELADVLGRQ